MQGQLAAGTEVLVCYAAAKMMIVATAAGAAAMKVAAGLHEAQELMDSRSQPAGRH